MSHINDLSLEEFIIARLEYCQETHNKTGDCDKCLPLINVSKELIVSSILPLSECYRKHFAV